MRDFQTALESNAKCAIAIAHNNHGDWSNAEGVSVVLRLSLRRHWDRMQAVQLPTATGI